MSVRTMARVWEGSQHAGTDLLMLLAIADFSDDDGRAFPAVATLATKCRMKMRNCQYILRSLEKSGELSILENQGPHGANLYRINLNRLGVQGIAGVQHSAPGGAMHCTGGVQSIASKPSVNHQEPSTNSEANASLVAEAGDDQPPASNSKPAPLPDCPQQEILALYAELLPQLPQPVAWEGGRADALRARWRWYLAEQRKKGKPSGREEGLEFFRRLFAYVGECDFLMGRSGKWEADLGWIVKAENFAKILAGNYGNKDAG